MVKQLVTIILIILISIVSGCNTNQSSLDDRGIPNLPQPIAKERALVTTAGQGIDGLIVAKYTNQLNISNYYRNHAEAVDLQDVSSLIIALGISPSGLDAAYMDFKKEKERLNELVKGAVKKKMPILLVHIGGMERRSPQNDQLTKELAKNANYLVVVEEGNEDGFFTKLAQEQNLPFTEVSSMEGIKVPLNSAYR